MHSPSTFYQNVFLFTPVSRPCIHRTRTVRQVDIRPISTYGLILHRFISNKLSIGRLLNSNYIGPRAALKSHLMNCWTFEIGLYAIMQLTSPQSIKYMITDYIIYMTSPDDHRRLSLTVFPYNSRQTDLSVSGRCQHL